MKFYGGSTAYYGEVESAGFYTGGALTSLVPQVYDVAIGGRPYLIDLSQPFYRQYHRQVAPLIRTQADTSNEPGEQSMDPNSLWRRSFEDWRDGGGQRYLDRSTSLDTMFYTSQGIDCLTVPWQISLLPTTTQGYTSTNTNLQLVVANGSLFLSDGTTVQIGSGLSWGAVAGTPGVTISSMCTDGISVYIAVGASGIYRISKVGLTYLATQYVTSAIGTTAVIGYCNGRLMLGNNGSGGDGKLYNIIASGTLPSALFAPGNTNATWVGFAEGNNFIYAGINIANKAYVYGVGITSDGTTLDAPVIQTYLPVGETIGSLFGYLGALLLGTSLGVRYCTTSSAGVTLGSVIPTTAGGVQWTPSVATQTVQAFGAWGRWVYFGWTDYTSSMTGLGRLDLENFSTANIQPAYASDLMATAQGAVTGVTSYTPSGGTALTIFAVSGHGVYVQSTDLVASGSITSGYILYDLVDEKIPALLDLQTVGPVTAGSVQAYLSVDGAAQTLVGTMPTGSQTPGTFATPSTPGERFEVTVTLNSNAGATAGPTLTRWTLRAYPAPQRPIIWQLPLVLDEQIITQSSGQVGFDPLVELLALESMAASGQPVTYQEANVSYQVFVQDVEFLPDQLTTDKHYFNGIALVTVMQLPIPKT